MEENAADGSAVIFVLVPRFGTAVRISIETTRSFQTRVVLDVRTVFSAEFFRFVVRFKYAYFSQ